MTSRYEMLSFERDLVYLFSQKVCRNMEKYPKSRGGEVVVAGGFNNIKTVFVDLHTNTNTPSLCLHIQRIIGATRQGWQLFEYFCNNFKVFAPNQPNIFCTVSEMTGGMKKILN